MEITYGFEDEGLYLSYNRKYNRKNITGFVSSKDISCNDFMIKFKETGVWEVTQGNNFDNNLSLEFRNFLPKIVFNKDSFKTIFNKCYYKIFSNDTKIESILLIVSSARKQKHGTMLVILDDIQNELDRLKKAGFYIEINKPNFSIEKHIERITSIDGALLLDKEGNIYLIGVMLDGDTPQYGIDMSRGARYNSAIKYTYSCMNKGIKNLAIVFSEDGYYNFITDGKEWND